MQATASRAAALLLEAGRRALDSGALATAEATLERARALTLSDDPIIVDIEECLADGARTGGQARPGRRGGRVAPRPAWLPTGACATAGRGAPPARPRRGGGDPLDGGRGAAGTGAEEAAEMPTTELRRPHRRAVSAQVAIMSGPIERPTSREGALEVAERLGATGGRVRGTGDRRALRAPARPRRGRSGIRACRTPSPTSTAAWSGACGRCTSSAPSSCFANGGVDAPRSKRRELALSLGALATVGGPRCTDRGGPLHARRPRPGGVVARARRRARPAVPPRPAARRRVAFEAVTPCPSRQTGRGRAMPHGGTATG